MSGQKIRLLSDLLIISQIKPGQTLVVDSMTVISHSWSTSIWRSIKGGKENRWRTTTHIRDIIFDTLNELRREFDPELYNYLELALQGFANLKETYSGEYYLCGDITKIIDRSREEMAKLIKPEEINLEEQTVIPNELEEEVKAQLETLDQKICPDAFSEREGGYKDKSTVEAVVTASDRTGSEEAAQREIIDDSSSSNRKDNIGVTSSLDCTRNTCESISRDTTHVVLTASDSVLKKKTDEPQTRPVRRRRIWSKRIR